MTAGGVFFSLLLYYIRSIVFISFRSFSFCSLAFSFTPLSSSNLIFILTSRSLHSLACRPDLMFLRLQPRALQQGLAARKFFSSKAVPIQCKAGLSTHSHTLTHIHAYIHTYVRTYIHTYTHVIFVINYYLVSFSTSLTISTIAIAYAPSEDLKVETITVDAPKAGEVRLKVAANALCHTDLYTW